MAKTSAFDQNPSAYDDWFNEHNAFYESELNAIASLMPGTGNGIEIGVGTARFAQPLGIKVGTEPSSAMATIARQRGIQVIDAVAENLPLKSETFDFALIVTTICFLDSPMKAISEAFRILKPNGILLIGFIDKQSPLGAKYQRDKAQSRFYKEATFHTVDDIIQLLVTGGFADLTFAQTLFSKLEESDLVQPATEGYGDGSFVVVRARKPDK